MGGVREQPVEGGGEGHAVGGGVILLSEEALILSSEDALIPLWGEALNL